MPQAIHTAPPSTATHLDPQQPNSTQPDPDPDSDSEIALTLQAGGKLEVLCAKFLWQEGRQVWKLHEVAPLCLTPLASTAFSSAAAAESL